MDKLPLSLSLVELPRLPRVVHAKTSLSCYQTAARARTSTVDPLIQLQLSRSKGAEMMLPPPKCADGGRPQSSLGRRQGEMQ